MRNFGTGPVICAWVLALLLLPVFTLPPVPYPGPAGTVPSVPASALPPSTPASRTVTYNGSSGAYLIWKNITQPWGGSDDLAVPANSYDPATGDIVTFGGGANVSTGGSLVYSNTTWAMNPSGQWQELNTSSAPPPMMGASLNYIGAPYHEFILFGGMNGTTAFNETWALNMTTLRWTELKEPVHPSRRVTFMTAEMPGDTGFYLFGGGNTSGGISGLVLDRHTRNDTWEFIPAAGWTNLTKPGPAPSSRAGGTLVPTSQPSTYLLYGGVSRASAGPELFTDTWLFNASTDTWKVTNSTGSPSSFGGCGLYDPQSNENLFIDGYGYMGTSNTSWRWSNPLAQWSEATTNVGLPTLGFVGGGCVWDAAASGAVLFGGIYESAIGNGTVFSANSTYLVRDVGIDLAVSSGAPLLQRSPFNATLTMVNYLGVTASINLTANLSDSSGSLTPAVFTITEGVAVSQVTVWRAQGSDTLTACALALCLSEVVVFSAYPSQLEVRAPPGVMVAGTPFSVGLQVVNASGQLVGGWSGVATLAVAPDGPLYTVPVVNGTGSATVVVDRCGNYSLLGSVPGLPGGTAPLDVAHAALGILTVSLSATSVVAGGAVDLSYNATDPYGNPVPLQSVNLSDTLHDVVPATVKLTAPAGSFRVNIGATAGTDTLTLQVGNVTGHSGPLTVTPAKVLPKKGTTSPWPYYPYILLAPITVAVLAVLGLFWVLRRRKKKAELEKKSDKETPVPYIGFLPFLAEKDEEDWDEKNGK